MEFFQRGFLVGGVFSGCSITTMSGGIMLRFEEPFRLTLRVTRLLILVHQPCRFIPFESPISFWISMAIGHLEVDSGDSHFDITIINK